MKWKNSLKNTPKLTQHEIEKNEHPASIKNLLIYPNFLIKINVGLDSMTSKFYQIMKK